MSSSVTNRAAAERRAPRGVEILQDGRLNKGTAFTEEERDRLGLRGLLPPRVFTQEEQEDRVLANLRALDAPLDQYLALVALLDRNERLFYRTIIDHLAEFLPVVYTPTVGDACKKFGRLFRETRGLYISARDRGQIREILRHWPAEKVSVIVVTDGARILGLGDLGAHGMGIPIGKLTLYTACGGVDPALGLPVMLDVGTDNEALRADPHYIGLAQPRVRGAEYLELVDEFVEAVGEVFPGALIQFEDFATTNATSLLARYRSRACTFNDDIQGTAAVTLAGLLNAARVTGVPLTEQRILFGGAGVAVGCAELIVKAMQRLGMSEADARSRCWFFDSNGLAVAGRPILSEALQPFAQQHPGTRDLVEAIELVRPTALIGLSGVTGLFTQAALQAMAAINPRPIVFAMSNPTSQAECTAQAAYFATEGRVVFASGSPFEPVDWQGERRIVGQANNAYIFPGLGLGVVSAGIRHVTDSMFLAAADALVAATATAELETGSLYPAVERILGVSIQVAEAVVRTAFAEGLAAITDLDGVRELIAANLYDPRYPER
ncbi:MAG: NAD-dependent malic enzyme [Gemmatimonadales bacterium]